MIVLGVDIGLHGAIALLDEEGGLLAAIDMPCLCNGVKGRPAVNAPLLAEIIFKAKAARAFVELVGPRPAKARCRASVSAARAASSKAFWPPAAFL